MTKRTDLSKLCAMSAHLRALVGVVVLASGCGVSTQEFDARTNELRRCEDRLAASQARQQAAETAVAEEQKQLEAAQSQLTEIEGVLAEVGYRGGGDLDAVRKAVSHGMRAKKIASVQADERARLEAGLRGEIELGVVRLETRDGMLRLVLPEEGLFARGTLLLAPTGRKLLDAVTRELGQLPMRKLLVSGHTDNSIKGNFALSVGRARLVAESLARGVAEGRLAVAGYAEFDPIGDNSTEDGRARNRRVEIALIPAPDFVAPPEGRSAPATRPPVAEKYRKSDTTPASSTLTDDPGLQP